MYLIRTTIIKAALYSKHYTDRLIVIRSLAYCWTFFCR